MTGKPPGPYRRRNAAAWALLALSTALFTALLEFLHLPAATLLGGILAGIFVSLRGADIQASTALFHGGQSIIGCMIAGSLSLPVLRGMLDNWLPALGIVGSVIIVGFLLGWIMTVRRILPGTTAIWGSSPGGAMVMTIMSQFYGADMRLVAFMQYLRVVVVSLIAALMALALGADSSGAGGPSFMASLFPPTDWCALFLTLALAVSSACIGRLTRIPAGSLLLPMVAGAFAHNSGLLVIELPGWLLTLCFALTGWCIGLRFNRPVFLYAVRVLPKLLLAVLLMVGLSGLLAVLLVLFAGLDPLTAYLATSPGGLDAVAIVAASSGADMVFVMAVQTARLFLVLLTVPPLARFAAGRMEKRLKDAAGKKNDYGME